MKKIIRISLLLLCISFITGNVNAQLHMVGYDAANKPLATKTVTAPQAALTTVSGTQPKSMTGGQPVSATAKTATPTKLPAVSNQGGVEPLLSFPEQKVTKAAVTPAVSTTKTTATKAEIVSAPVKIVTTNDIKADRSSPAPVVKTEVVTENKAAPTTTPAQVVVLPKVNKQDQ
jgi:hypothetical protein